MPKYVFRNLNSATLVRFLNDIVIVIECRKDLVNVLQRFVYDYLLTFPTENVRLILKIIDCNGFRLRNLPAINYARC